MKNKFNESENRLELNSRQHVFNGLTVSLCLRACRERENVNVFQSWHFHAFFCALRCNANAHEKIRTRSKSLKKCDIHINSPALLPPLQVRGVIYSIRGWSRSAPWIGLLSLDGALMSACKLVSVYGQTLQVLILLFGPFLYTLRWWCLVTLVLPLFSAGNSATFQEPFFFKIGSSTLDVYKVLKLLLIDIFLY